MTDYFSDFEVYGAGQALPTPADTPYQTPVFSRSRRSSRYGTSSPAPSSSPPPLPKDVKCSEKSTDEEISLLDPRRFTPTLHASLVAEILSLRRDLESRNTVIEDLENNCQVAKAEKDSLNEKLSQSLRENRSAKKQLSQLESTTLATLEELVKERDDARNVETDLRGKIESSDSKIRKLEEDAKTTHDVWGSEKERWDGEKRILERRVHIAESRLKTVLDEFAAHQAAAQSYGTLSECDGEDESRDSGLGHESDTASIRSASHAGSIRRSRAHNRNMSASSRHSLRRTPSLRFSVRSGSALDNYVRSNGISLADELVFDEEDEDDIDEIDDEEDEFTEHELRARRALESRQSTYQDDKAKRVLGLMTIEKGAAVTMVDISPTKTKVRDSSLDTGYTGLSMLQREYVDRAVQYTPPSSPTVTSMKKAERQSLDIIPSPQEHGANQRRKRTSIISPTESPQQPLSVEPKPSAAMVSTECQTTEEIPSPEEIEEKFAPRPDTPMALPTPEMVTVSTQTDVVEAPKERSMIAPSRAALLPPLIIPAITIHPASAPTSPVEPLLPPGTKSTGCQTTSELRGPMRSVSVQTEEIRLDMRRFNLPAHLLPSSISSNPPTPEHKKSVPADRSSPSWQADDIPSSPPSFLPSSPVEDRYPGNNDNGRLAESEKSDIRRPFRSSSLFAGFGDEENNSHHDEEDSAPPPPPLRKAPSVPRSLKQRQFGNPPTPVPEGREPLSDIHELSGATDSPPSPNMQPMAPSRDSLEKPSKVSKPMRSGYNGKQPNMRRSAMISSGAHAHQHRSRSPSLGSVGSSSVNTQGTQSVQPPFPVPTRSSSRRIFGLSKSEGSQSPTPRSGGGLFASRRSKNKSPTRKDSLRKVRSAAVMPRHARQRSRSPPLPSPTILMPPVTPELPTFPKTSFSSSQLNYGPPRQSSVTSHPTTTSAYSESVPETSRPTIVDAIAATMVGEWMWKYVRRRKSFGVAEQEFTREEAAASISVNGSRHRRWVWLSPYERSIMWSNKQPTSGTALLGKSGRKLAIQSVLDVKDDAPLPKGGAPYGAFNRSILILTPTRALKFTTFSKDRHYLWLTALSFLAHSSGGVPDLNNLPSVPERELSVRPNSRGGAVGRKHVRDSVVISKNKGRPPVPTRHITMPLPSPMYDIDDDDDPAAPPAIPRHPQHSRKRSSTGPAHPPPAIRSFSHNHAISTANSTTSSDYNVPSLPSSIYNRNMLHGASSSTRTSEASSNAVRNNFFEAVGTVRMEAFVEPRVSLEAPAPHIRTGRRRVSSNFSHDNPNRAGVYMDDFDAFDPFKGF